MTTSFKPYAYQLTGDELSMLILAMRTGLRNTKEIDTECGIERVRSAYEFLINMSPSEGGFPADHDSNAAYMDSVQKHCNEYGAD